MKTEKEVKELLKKRLAQGEITIEQYEMLLKHMNDDPGY